MCTLRNKVQVIDTLGNMFEVKITPNGRKAARFSIATKEFITMQRAKKVKEAHWYNLVVWGKVAEIVEKCLNRGSDVAIEVNELLLLGSKAL